MLLVSAYLLLQPPPVQDPDEVREAADEVLSRPEFGEAPRTLLQQIADWIRDLFGDSRPPSSEASGPGDGGSGVLTLVLLVVIIVLVVLVIRALLRQPRLRRSDEDPEPTIEVTEHLSASSWDELAAGHEAAGDWKEAVRCRFRALLERLVDREVIDEVPGRTTGELRAEVTARAPGAAADFTAAADVFDEAWYGEDDTGPEELRRVVDLAAAVLAATERALVAAAPAPAPVDDEGPGE
jgi:hypothetical protein